MLCDRITRRLMSVRQLAETRLTERIIYRLCYATRYRRFRACFGSQKRQSLEERPLTGSLRPPHSHAIGELVTAPRGASVFRPVRVGPFPGVLDRRPWVWVSCANTLHSRQCLHPFAPGLHEREPRVHRLALAIAAEGIAG